MRKFNKVNLVTAVTISLAVTALSNKIAIAEEPETKPIWVFTKFKEAKTPTEFNRLTIGLPQSTEHLLSSECKVASAKANLPVNLYVRGTQNKVGDRIEVKFYRGRFEQTLTGSLLKKETDKVPAKILIDVPATAPLWNALLAMKGLNIKVDGVKPINFNLMRGTQQRVSNYLQSCRSKSVSMNTNKDAEKIVTRKYFCKDGSILNVKLIVSGTIPSARLTHNDLENVRLDPTVTASGIIYQNKSHKLEMRGFEAKLQTNEEQLTCSTNLPQN